MSIIFYTIEKRSMLIIAQDYHFMIERLLINFLKPWVCRSGKILISQNP